MVSIPNPRQAKAAAAVGSQTLARAPVPLHDVFASLLRWAFCRRLVLLGQLQQRKETTGEPHTGAAPFRSSSCRQRAGQFQTDYCGRGRQEGFFGGVVFMSGYLEGGFGMPVLLSCREIVAVGFSLADRTPGALLQAAAARHPMKVRAPGAQATRALNSYTFRSFSSLGAFDCRRWWGRLFWRGSAHALHGPVLNLATLISHPVACGRWWASRQPWR